MSDLTITNVFVIVALGLIATGVMTAVLYGARRVHFTDLDIVGTVGSVFTRQRTKYSPVGWTVHLVAGVLFAFLYIAVLNSVSVTRPAAFTLIGAVLGAVHGLLVSFFMVVFVAEHHRLRKMRGGAGYDAAVVQWAAHIVYGSVLGLTASTYLWMLHR